MIGRSVAVLLLSFASTVPAFAADPSGNWARGDGNAKVRIAHCGAAYCATNTWIKDPNSSEKVGHKLIMNLKPKSDDVLVGDAFDPQRNQHYAMEMHIARTTLSTRGCIVGGLLCKTVTWSRL